MNYDWPKKIEKEILDYIEEKGLKGKQKDAFLEKAYKIYDSSLIPIYESVGFLVAHSMGEPATQLILRTKHYAGAAEVSMGSGIERLEELVDARAKTKHPTMKIYIKKGLPKTDKAYKKYLKKIVYRFISDFGEIIEDLENKTIMIKFNPILLKEVNLTLEEVIENLKHLFKIKPQIEENKLIYFFKDVGLLNIRKIFMKLKNEGIIGIKGISEAIVSEENGEKVIITQGTNLKEVLKLDFVDINKTYSNDVLETYKIFGIEAARELLINELQKVYEGINIDYRHVSLLVDTMCYNGNVKGIVRSGIISTKASPLARAAFEQTEKVIFEAALEREVEKFNGVVENVIAGLPIRMGTGNVELSMEFNDDKKKVKK